MTYQPSDPYQPQSPAPQSPVPYSPGPYPPAYQQMYGQPIIVTQKLPTSGAATASLVLGIVGITIGWCLMGIPCILAVIFGHLALNEIKTGAKGGNGQAIAGLIMGYIALVPTVFAFFAMVVGNVS